MMLQVSIMVSVKACVYDEGDFLHDYMYVTFLPLLLDLLTSGAAKAEFGKRIKSKTNHSDAGR